MSSISTEAENENQLTVEEYVRYVKLKENLSRVLDKNIMDMLREAEESIDGLTVDVVVKYSVGRKKH